MTLITTIADAVVTELNGAPSGTFAQAFTAARQYRPQFDLVELKTVRVSVVPKAIGITGLMRNANQHDVSIDVAVQKKVSPTDPAELDGLMLLTEQIADLLQDELHARGVAVVIEAVHTCMTVRGVRKPGSLCVTSAMRGCFRNKASTRAELMTLIYGNHR